MKAEVTSTEKPVEVKPASEQSKTNTLSKESSQTEEQKPIVQQTPEVDKARDEKNSGSQVDEPDS